MMVLDTCCGVLQKTRDLQVGAAFQCGLCLIPFVLAVTVWQIHRVLQVEHHVAEHLCQIDCKTHLKPWESNVGEYKE